MRSPETRQKSATGDSSLCFSLISLRTFLLGRRFLAFVVLSCMSDKLTKSHETLSANLACEGSLRVMVDHVSPKTGGIAVAPLAVLTCIRLLPCVSPFVDLEVGGSSEVLFALIAREGFLAAVESLVVLQVTS